MNKKIGVNQPCPCGSGRKYKKCCGAPHVRRQRVGVPHTQLDRATALTRLDDFGEQYFAQERDECFETLWSGYDDWEERLSPGLRDMSEGVFDSWFLFDHRFGEDNQRVVDHFLEHATLSAAERSFLTMTARSTMRLYEVVQTVPGSSVTVRDRLEGGLMTVHERAASRSLSKDDWIGARIIARGCSGQPEFERGLLPITAFVREGLEAELRAERDDFRAAFREAPLDHFYAITPPLIHDVWLLSIFEPPVPELLNRAGERLVFSRVVYEVCDEPGLLRALDHATPQRLEDAGPGRWLLLEGVSTDRDASQAAEAAPLAALTLQGERLELESETIERAARARASLEEIAGPSVRHRSTVHEDLRERMRQELTDRALGIEEARPAEPSNTIDPRVAESLVLDHYARHYRSWLDEPVPALKGHTPRQAAKSHELRVTLVSMIQELEGMYERALKDGQPAYDPSWMRVELGLAEQRESAELPQLAHERVYGRVPGSAVLLQEVAKRLRASPDSRDSSAVPDERAWSGDLELQRFLRQGRPAANDTDSEGALLRPYLPLFVPFELHHRKVFWVDEALSFMLEKTELDVQGRELRAPFASFALALTDRHALSLGERWLAGRKNDPLQGQILRVITVYVAERATDGGRVLHFTFAFDALGADLPSLIPIDIASDDAPSLQASLDLVAPRAQLVADIGDSSPDRALLRLALNAILYATSASVKLEVKPLRSNRRASTQPAEPLLDGSLYYLPGAIDIRQVRRLQEIARAPDGRGLLSRFMVRGHWRRPAQNWKDQRLRWVEPYWKGPDMAATIEKAYRLKP